MKYDGVLDTWHEECGVFGLYDRTSTIGTTIYKGLVALQHRGQEGAGIAVVHESKIGVVKGTGLVKEALQDVSTLAGHIGIGHVRYSTTGIENPDDVQPLVGTSSWGTFAVAHNGNLKNAPVLRRELELQGSKFTTTMDSEVIVHLIQRSNESTILGAIQQACRRLEGAFSLTIVTDTMLIGVRDFQGYRPLCIGRIPHGYVLASESCAIEAIGGIFIRDVRPGEMILIDGTGFRSIPCHSSIRYGVTDYRKTEGDIQSEAISRDGAEELEIKETKETVDAESVNIEQQTVVEQHTCVFEYIYFAHPTSVIDGQSVLEARAAMGRQLAKETQYEADIVMPIPNSGTLSARGYAEASGISYREGLVRNPRVLRTFIEPNQLGREEAVRNKFSVIPKVVQGKRIVLIDDSIVRGTTSRYIVSMLRQAGAKEIYLCLASEPVRYPCYFGIDTSDAEELLAYRYSIEEIRQYIGVDRLYYLSHEGLMQSLKQLEAQHLCVACFTGHYPSPVGEEYTKGGTYVCR